MNTKIAALKKKIELKNKQLETKEDFLLRCKEGMKELRHELELLQGELATEEMREMAELLSEKNLSFEDVKAAVASGVIVGKAKENENNDKTEEGIAEISQKSEETKKEENRDNPKEEQNNAGQGKTD